MLSSASLYQLPEPKVHDLGLVVRQLREAVVEFRTDVELELHGRGLARLDFETRHSHRALDAVFRLTVIFSSAPRNAGPKHPSPSRRAAL